MQTLKTIIILSFSIMTLICCQEQVDDWAPPVVYSVTVEPNEAKVGDEVTIVYIRDHIECDRDINYNYDLTVDADGRLMYIGHHESIEINYDTTNDRILSKMYYFGAVDTAAKDITVMQEIVKFKSISQKFLDDDKTEITVKCYVPQNAKSGYMYIHADYSPMSPGQGGDNNYAAFTVIDE